MQTSQPGMQQAAQIFSDRATDFTQELQRVNSTMASLQGSWTGSASINFNQAFRDHYWTPKLINMMDVIGVNARACAAQRSTRELTSNETLAAATGGSPGWRWQPVGDERHNLHLHLHAA